MVLFKKHISIWNNTSVFIDNLLKNKYRINRVFYHVLILAFLSFLIACDKCKEGEEYPLQGTNLSMNDIAGNWQATTASFSYDTLFLDVIAEEGSALLVIQSNGRFTFTIKLPEEADDVSTGQLGFDEEWLAISFDDDPEEYAYYFIQLANGILTLRGPAEYDLDDDGTLEPASLNLVLIGGE